MVTGINTGAETRQQIRQHMYSISIGLVLSLSAYMPANADVTVDNTLGSAADGTDLTGPDFIIDDAAGVQVGTNRFHSFSQFDISDAQSATFTSTLPLGQIDQVLARVIDANVTTIDGPITNSIAGANLFIFNPSGMIIGPNATLNVSAGIEFSTATTFFLDDGGSFGTFGENLTSGQVSGRSIASGSLLEVTDSFLSVLDGQSLALSGGNVNIDGATITAVDGTISILADGNFTNAAGITGSVLDAGTDGQVTFLIGGDFYIDSTDVSAGGGISFAKEVEESTDVEIRNESKLITSDSAGPVTGDIVIDFEDPDAANSPLTISNSLITTAPVFPGNSAGDIIIVANDDISVESGTVIDASAVGGGDAGNIRIGSALLLSPDASDTTTVSLTGTTVSANADGSADAGDIDIEAAASVTLSTSNIQATDSNGLFTIVNLVATTIDVNNSTVSVDTINGGSDGGRTITLEGDNIDVDATSVLTASATGTGDSGQINFFYGPAPDGAGSSYVIDGDILVNGRSGAFEGDSISVEADDVTLRGNLQADDSDGNSNVITVRADKFLMEGGTISTVSTAGGGGTVNIVSDDFDMNQAYITAGSEDAFNTGTVNISFKDLPNASTMDMVGVFGNEGDITTDLGTAGGGAINIDMNSVVIGRSQINGQTGSTTITANSLTMFDVAYINDRPDIAAPDTVEPDYSVTVDLNVNFLDMDESVIRAYGNGGSKVTINGRAGAGTDAFVVDLTDSDISTAPSYEDDAIGSLEYIGAINAGDIEINAESVFLQQDSLLEANATWTTATNPVTTAGDITITASEVLDIVDSNIEARAARNPDPTIASAATGGTIRLNSDNLSIRQLNEDFATVSTGDNGGGNIIIRGSDGDGSAFAVDLNGGQLIARTDGVGAQPAASIDLRSFDITMNEGASGVAALITTSSLGSNAGTIDIVAEDLELNPNTAILAESEGTAAAGTINISGQPFSEGQQFLALDDALISAKELGGGTAGTINIDTDVVELFNNAEINTGIGTINITADFLVMGQGSQLNGMPDVTTAEVLAAPSFVNLNINNLLMNDAVVRAYGNGGLIKVRGRAGGETSATLVDLQNDSGLETDPSFDPNVVTDGYIGSVNGADIDVRADTINLVNSTFATPSTYSTALFAVTSSGDITVTANDLLISDEAGLFAVSSINRIDPTIASNGTAGNITVNADSIILQNINGSDFSGMFTGGNGGGSITIRNKAGTGPVALLEMQGARIQANTMGVGNQPAATIDIQAINLGLLERNGVASSITARGDGSDAGSIAIATDNLLLNGGSSIDASPDGVFAGGNISITGLTTASNYTLDNGFINISGPNAAPGGSISITGEALTLRNRGRISSSTDNGQAALDNISINTNILNMEGDTTIESSGAGGQSIAIAVNDLNMTADGLGIGGHISADSYNTIGGSVQINANTIDLAGTSRISASVSGDPGPDVAGGNVAISAISAVNISGAGADIASVLASGSDSANGGTITISANDGITLASTAIVADSGGAGAGNGGTIAISTATNGTALTMDNARISANANGGSIVIDTGVINTGLLDMTNGSALDAALGSIDVTADSLTMTSSLINRWEADNLIGGAAAPTNPTLVRLNVNSISLDDSQIYALGNSDSLIRVRSSTGATAALLNMSNFAQLSTSRSSGFWDSIDEFSPSSGNIDIISSVVALTTGSSISTAVGIASAIDASPQAGDIFIAAGDLSLNDSSEIRAFAESDGIGGPGGVAGNITLLVNDLRVAQNTAPDLGFGPGTGYYSGISTGGNSGGSILIRGLGVDAATNVDLFSGLIYAGSDAPNNQNPGSIEIRTQNLNMQGGDLGAADDQAPFISVDASGSSAAGQIIVAADTINMQDFGSSISADAFGSGSAGSIAITELTPGVSFLDVDTISASALNGGAAGQIIIDMAQVDIGFGASIAADGNSLLGGAANIQITATNQLTMVEDSSISSQGGTDNLIDISAGTLFFDGDGEGADPRITADGIAGNGGTVSITADAIDLFDFNVSAAGTSNMGNLVFVTDALQFGQLDVSSVGAGNAGSITISERTADTLNLNLFGQSIDASANGTGKAGSVSIDANSLTLTNGSVIKADGPIRSFDTPSINIIANDVLLNNSQITANNALYTGEIVGINTDTLSLQNGSALDASAGDLRVTADSLLMTDSQINRLEAETLTGTAAIPGAATRVILNVDAISLDNSQIWALGAMAPIPSLIQILGKAEGFATSLDLQNFSKISTSRSSGFWDDIDGASPSSGSIIARVDDVTLNFGSSISTAVGVASAIDAAPQAGNISITASTLSLSDSSELRAYALSDNDGIADGFAGDIRVDANIINISQNTAIDLGTGGSGYYSGISTGGNAGGSIRIRNRFNSGAAASLTLNSGLIYAGTTGTDNQEAGSIDIQAGTLSMDGGDLGFEDFQEPFISVDGGVDAPGGSIQIGANTLTMNSGARISADAAGDSGAGSITITELTPDAGVFNVDTVTAATFNGGAANVTGGVGSVTIVADSVNVNAEGEVIASGSVNIDAADFSMDSARIFGDRVLIGATNTALINSSILGGAGGIVLEGRGGNLSAQSLELFSISQIRTEEIDGGGTISGDISISADSISLSQLSGISTVAFASDTGAGDILISANDLTISDESAIISVAAMDLFGGEGNANNSSGNITLNVNNLLINEALDTSFPPTPSSFSGIQVINVDGTGPSGNILIRGRDSNGTDNLPSTLVQVTGNTIANYREVPGVAGNIDIYADVIDLSSGSEGATQPARIISSGVNGADSGGVSLFTDSLTTFQSNISVASSGDGDAGNLLFNVDELDLSGGLSVSTDGAGDAGTITITERTVGALDLVLAGAVIEANANGTGNAGLISIDANSITIANGGSLQANGASAGSILIAADTVDMFGGIIVADAFGSGSGGSISIQGNTATGPSSLRMFDSLDESGVPVGAIITASSNLGDAGTVEIGMDSIAQDSLSNIQAVSFGDGNAGNLVFNTDAFDLAADGLSVSSNGAGNAGAITIAERTAGALDLLLDGASIEASAFGAGAAGTVNISANSVALVNGGLIAADGNSAGGLPNIDITANSLSVNDQSSIQSEGNANNTINIRAANLSMVSGEGEAEISVSSDDQLGEAGGTLNLNVDTINMDRAIISADSLLTGGNVVISANNNPEASSLTMVNSSVTASGNLDGGNITIDLESVSLDNSRLLAVGDAVNSSGLIDVRAGALLLANDSAIFGQTINLRADNIAIRSGTNIFGRSGGISIGGRNSAIAQQVEVDNSSLFIDLADGEGTEPGGTAGSIAMRADRTVITNNARVVTAAFASDANAGDITINSDDVTISNGALLQTDSDGAGNAGNILIEGTASPADVVLIDNGFLTASAIGGGNAGSITIEALDLTITGSETDVNASALGAGTGGNINLIVDAMLLENLARIRTGVENGTGGTITVSADNSLTIQSGGSINALTTGDGDASSIVLQGKLDCSTGFITITGDGSGIFTSSAALGGSAGSSGSISVAAQSLGLAGQGGISSSTVDGAAGGIVLNVVDADINNASITSLSSGEGAGATIAINGLGNICPGETDSPAVMLANNGIIDSGNGTVTVNNPSSLTLDDNSSITSAGNILLAGPSVLTLTNSSDITSLDGQVGIPDAGDVSIDDTSSINPSPLVPPDPPITIPEVRERVVDLNNESTVEVLGEVETQVSPPIVPVAENACSVGTAKGRSSLTRGTQGNPPIAPGGYQFSPDAEDDEEEIAELDPFASPATNNQTFCSNAY